MTPKRTLLLIAPLGALLLFPSAAAIPVDLLGMGEARVLEDHLACVDLDVQQLDAASAAASACADASTSGAALDASARAQAAGAVDARADASAAAGPGGADARAGADAAGHHADAQGHASAAGASAGAEADGIPVGPVQAPPEGVLERIGSWIRGIFG